MSLKYKISPGLKKAPSRDESYPLLSNRQTGYHRENLSFARFPSVLFHSKFNSEVNPVISKIDLIDGATFDKARRPSEALSFLCASRMRRDLLFQLADRNCIQPTYQRYDNSVASVFNLDFHILSIISFPSF